MLASSLNETPRPRPPAKVRRSSALLHAASTPPPSYAAAFTLTPDGKPRMDTLLGSPMAATFQRVAWDLAGDRETPPVPETQEDVDWMNERSREELSELLVKADDLIKERENELEMASAVCKNLYDNNVVLKSKHQQLLARLPSTPSPTPSPEVLSRSSSRYSVNLSRPISEYESSPVDTYKGHARKISVSTAEISHLADQNAELLDKLERLESESLSADQSGRRALKRLEKEILTLREELEKTQAKSEELEQKTKAGFGWDSEKVVNEVLRKKEEREAKLRAMRNLGQGRQDEEDEDSEIRDFAPEGSTFGGPNGTFSFTPRKPSSIGRPTYGSAPLTPYPESHLIAQLLEKIQELEHTNGRILDQQAETANQLNAMQRETEHISKVYEYFADANITEAGDVDGISDGGRSRDDTIRFKSFRRNLEGDFSASSSMTHMRQSLNISSTSRTRKSLVGLFDGPEGGRQDASTPDQLKVFNLPVPFASPYHSDGHRKSQSVESNGLVSPALSSLSLSPSCPSQNPFGGPQRTLENELGNEFSDGWGLSASKHPHLRTNSLYDLTGISAPSSPSPSPHTSFRNIGSPQEPRDREAMPTPMSISMNVEGSSSGLRLSVEPPTPDKAGKDTTGTAGKQASLRYHRMTETLRSRTNRWVDSRFAESLAAIKADVGEPAHEERPERPSTPLPLRLASVFDTAVENVTGQPAERGRIASSSSSGSVKGVDNPEKKPERKGRGFGGVMLELWLWLQFCVIILVFLWAMARRGPKSVLGEGGHRRSVSASAAR
ncbi:hypothetical protein H0H81_005863 [Sphagnurus paluster]|uniref:Uncharacterized protein n=1 Tax=Sphagnurus paluster TaxID=117069 RepID=A0A9P7FYM4_9AGAR|nr:hypothetical protein H0H81_005863 [Sphagnurus paluster]